jgi:hypothetical protein
MCHIERDRHRFYAKDNGLSMILYYPGAATAAAINALCDGALDPVIPD